MAHGPQNEHFFGIGTAALCLRNGELLIESQAANGLRQWSEHFSKIIWGNRLIPEEEAAYLKGVAWESISTIKSHSPVEVVPLPWAYDLDFIRFRKNVCAQLHKHIISVRYFHSSMASWNGCWGRQAALVAIKNKHPFSLHIETVTGNVNWWHARTLKAKIKFLFDYPLVKYTDAKILQEAAVVQCNGMDTYQHFALFCKNSKLIHDIHTTEKDLIESEKVKAKQTHIKKSAPLRIRYLGRLIPLKGPMEWIRALSVARDNEAIFNATWMGTGEMTAVLKAEIEKLNLSDCVSLLPFESDRKKVRRYLEDADLLLFTHLSLESSRVQKEALNLGTPIVGFRTAFAEELVSEFGGGSFAKMGDYEALGRLIAALSKDRILLSDLVGKAAKSGKRFTAKQVFTERAVNLREAIDLEWNSYADTAES